MTRKEWMKEHFPDEVDTECAGGVAGCPSEYSELTEIDASINMRNCANYNNCTDCWNAEIIPNGEVKNDEVEFVKVEREDKILSTALHGYGTEVQTWKFVEELGELLTAFARRRITDIAPVHKRGEETDNLAEEMADVQIMAAQMTMLYGIDKSIKAMRLKKLRRLAKRLGMEEVEPDKK